MVWFGNSIYFPICLAAWGSYQVRILPARAGEGTVLKKSLINQCTCILRVMLSLYICMVLPIRLWGIFSRGVLLLPAAIDFLARTTVCMIWGILRCYRYCGFKPSEMYAFVVLYCTSVLLGGYRVMIIMRILHCLLYAATAHVVWSPWPERIYSWHPSARLLFCTVPWESSTEKDFHA